MIGNDIVDLNNIKSNWKRARFLEKVFIENEQQIISISENPHQTAWLLWSMKEAAYKVYVQQFGKQFFNPKRLVCQLSSLNVIGEVSIDNRTFYTRSITSKNYIYTVAGLNNSENYNSAVLEVENKSYLIQSNTLKEHFLESFSLNNGLNYKDLNIRKDIVGIPEVFYNNTKLPIQLSLTHCGNYCGYVYF